jgi:hypothetical protein
VFCADQGREAGVQDPKGEDEGVQQTGRQVLRQHVREVEEAGAHGHQGELPFPSRFSLLLSPLLQLPLTLTPLLL